MKTVYPLQTKFAGGIKSARNCSRQHLSFLLLPYYMADSSLRYLPYYMADSSLRYLPYYMADSSLRYLPYYMAESSLRYWLVIFHEHKEDKTRNVSMGHGCPRYRQIRINRALSLTKGHNSNNNWWILSIIERDLYFMITYLCMKYESNTPMFSKDIAWNPFFIMRSRAITLIIVG